MQSKANSCIPRLYFLPEYLVQSEGLSLNFLLRGPDCFIHLHIMVMWYGSALLTTTKYRNTYIKPRKYPCLEICYPEEWFPQFTGRDIVATFLCLCISLCTSTACAHSIKIKIYSCKLLFCFSLFLFFCRYPLWGYWFYLHSHQWKLCTYQEFYLRTYQEMLWSIRWAFICGYIDSEDEEWVWTNFGREMLYVSWFCYWDRHILQNLYLSFQQTVAVAAVAAAVLFLRSLLSLIVILILSPKCNDRH